MTGYFGGTPPPGASIHRMRGASLMKFISIGLLLAVILTVLGISFMAEALHASGRSAARRQHNQQQI